MNSEIPTIGQKKRTCPTCGKPHPFTKCKYEDLVAMVTRLMRANQLLPGLMEANKEATRIANTFRIMARDSARALELVERVVKEKEYGDGDELWKEFMERLEKEWPRETLSQGTDEELENSVPENTTPSETENKPCTGTTPTGENTPLDS